MKLILIIVACSIACLPTKSFSKNYAESFLKNRKEIAEKNKVKYNEEKPFDLSVYSVDEILKVIPKRDLDDVNDVGFGLELIVDEDKDHVDDYIENIISEFKDKKTIEYILYYSIIYNHSYKTCSTDVGSDECLYQLALLQSLKECFKRKTNIEGFNKVYDIYGNRRVVSGVVMKALSIRNIAYGLIQLKDVKNYNKYYNCLIEKD